MRKEAGEDIFLMWLSAGIYKTCVKGEIFKLGCNQKERRPDNGRPVNLYHCRTCLN